MTVFNALQETVAYYGLDDGQQCTCTTGGTIYWDIRVMADATICGEYRYQILD